MDHRGFAPSPGSVEQSAYELDVIVDDIERLRQQLSLDRIVVIGHSGHGYMALEYAKKYPEHVSHVVMLGIIPNLSAASNEAVKQHWQDTATPTRKAAFEENLANLPDEQLTGLSPSQIFIKQYIRNTPKIWHDIHYDAAPLWEDVEINMEVFGHLWGEVFRDIDITIGLESLNTPVFLGLGQYDFLAPPCLWKSVESKFQNLTTHVFSHSGHTPQLEEPELFDKALLSWLRAHKVIYYLTGP